MCSFLRDSEADGNNLYKDITAGIKENIMKNLRASELFAHNLGLGLLRR